MAWALIVTQDAPGVGVDGAAYWVRADLTLPIATFNTLPTPGAVGFRAERSSGSLYQGDMYIVGGMSHNMRLTKRFGFVVQGILPPVNEIVNAAGSGTKIGVQASGTGITATIIPYVSLYDELTDERSPLSEAGPSIALTNQGLAWSNLPISQPDEDHKIQGDTTANATTTITVSAGTTRWALYIRIGDDIALTSAPTTYSRVLSVTSTTIVVASALGNGTTQEVIARRRPRWTHVELWRSVDGALPRLVARLQKGTTSFSEAVAAGSLGEAFIEDFSRFPRCRFNAIWHDRQVMSGDEENPSVVYLSLIGLPERKSSIELETRNGEPIVGLGVVRDTLLVFCQTSTYVVSGYTEDDIQINLIQPNLGLVSHFAQANIHGDLWIATNLGPFRTDGSSWLPMNKRLKDAWTKDYAERASDYEDCFAVHDEVRQVVRFYLGLHPRTNDDRTLTGRYTYLTADYTSCTPLENGETNQPRWSFDVYRREHSTAFQLSLPGARRKDLFSAACNGFFFIENGSETGGDGTGGAGATDEREMYIVHPADFAQDLGGNFAHGKKFVDLDLFIENENVAFDLEGYPGDEYAWPVDLATASAPLNQSVPLSALEGAAGEDYAPNEVQSFKLEGITGRALTLAIRLNPCGDLKYRGYQFAWVPGPASRRVVSDIGK